MEFPWDDARAEGQAVTLLEILQGLIEKQNMGLEQETAGSQCDAGQQKRCQGKHRAPRRESRHGGAESGRRHGGLDEISRIRGGTVCPR